MKINNIHAIAVLTILLTTTITVTCYAQEMLYVTGYWGTPGKPIIVGPGSEPVPLTIHIFNTGPYLLKKVKVELILPNHINFYRGSPQRYTVIIPPQGNVTLIFYLSISPHIKTGMYEITVRVRYDVYTLSIKQINNITIPEWRYEDTDYESHKITLPVIGIVNVSVYGVFWGTAEQPMSQYVSPGVKDIPLTIYLLNTGTIALTNVSVTLLMRYPIYRKINNKYVDSITKSIGYLPIGKPVPITFMVSICDNATEGTYVGTLIVRYLERGITKTINFTYHISGAKIDIYWSGWGVLEKGIYMKVGAGYRNIPYTIYLINTGNNYVSNVKIRLCTRYPIYSSESNSCIVKNVGTLPPGRPVPITFTLNIYPNASSGTYTSPIEIYVNEVRILRRYVTFEISKSCPDVMAIMFKPPRIYQDMFGVLLNMTLINMCEVIAKNVTIDIITPRGIEVIYKNATNLRIENLIPGKLIPIIVPLRISKDVKPGRYYLKILIRWCNGKIERNVVLDIYEKAKFRIERIETKNFIPGSSKAILTIYLKKLNNVKVKNVQVTLQPPSELVRFYVPSERVIELMTLGRTYVGEIEDNDLIKLSYLLEIDSDIPSGNYTFILTITWYQEGTYTPFTETIRFNIPIKRTFIDVLIANIPIIISIITVSLAVLLIVIMRRRLRVRS